MHNPVYPLVILTGAPCARSAVKSIPDPLSVLGGEHAGGEEGGSLFVKKNKKKHQCADPEHPSDVFTKVQETKSKQEQEGVRVCVV